MFYSMFLMVHYVLYHDYTNHYVTKQTNTYHAYYYIYLEVIQYT